MPLGAADGCYERGRATARGETKGEEEEDNVDVDALYLCRYHSLVQRHCRCRCRTTKGPLDICVSVDVEPMQMPNKPYAALHVALHLQQQKGRSTSISALTPMQIASDLFVALHLHRELDSSSWLRSTPSALESNSLITAPSVDANAPARASQPSRPRAGPSAPPPPLGGGTDEALAGNAGRSLPSMVRASVPSPPFSLWKNTLRGYRGRSGRVEVNLSPSMRTRK
ncbi:hypothetical protein B296_00021616 [Ensete ventricosum]|uniref:Uncharacterized protein n=1 Tax=Ensete ventricosum TaxID=4639 RepID=A0A426Z7E5_ENSVE|nr:hypothetical protein B296_00021616 [Ensete ventricosum]